MSFLDSYRLEAFSAVAGEASFTRGAARIGITQSAISQRVSKLEDDLGATLFVRDRDRVRLTSEGQVLLRYARAREALEHEMLAGLVAPASDPEALRGAVRIAGYSSVTRSVLLPALTPLVHPAQELTVHLFSRELDELPRLLRNGEADMIVIDRELPEAGLENLPLGEETNVLVEPEGELIRDDCYLDHDAEDTTTERFLRVNGRTFAGEHRSYMDDIYGILDGVAAGWGRAVVSAHLIDEVEGLRRVPGFMPLMTPLYLVFRKSRHQSKVHHRVVEALRLGCPALLGDAASAPR
ncbi:MAG: LysR family transcriptional regulator [Deltaproteobacteria bacterium]|nr:LysR family transcriptional regulator [Deltaproteobacteria bacterium]